MDLEGPGATGMCAAAAATGGGVKMTGRGGDDMDGWMDGWMDERRKAFELA